MRSLVLGSFIISSIFAFSANSVAEPVTQIAMPDIRAGDSWVFDRTFERGTTGFVRRRVDLTIQRVSEDTMVVGIKPDGAPTGFEDRIVGRDWSGRRLIDGREEVTGRPFTFPMKIGQSWKAIYADPAPRGNQSEAHFNTTYKVIGWEDVVVPAGTFHALKIEADGTADAQMRTPASSVAAVTSGVNGATGITQVQRAQSGVLRVLIHSTFYYAPEVKYFVKSEEEQFNADNVRVTHNTQELVSYKPSGTG